MIHHPECPLTTDPDAHCTCEDLDLALVQAETKLTLADMIRAGQQQGLLKKDLVLLSGSP